MGYKDMETALATVIKLHADYDANNVTQGDHRILGHGKAQAVILNPGAIYNRQVFAAPRRIHTTWVVNIGLHIGFRGEIADATDDIRTKRQTLMDHIDKYPALNGTANCISAFISGGSEPRILIGDPTRWWFEELYIRIIEAATIAIVG